MRNVTLENIEVGHTQGVDSSCYAGVISVVDSHNVSITNSVLFGSGSEGLTLRGVQGLHFKNSVIKECTQHILTISESTDIHFENAQFVNNRLSGNAIPIYGGDGAGESTNILFSDCTFAGNLNKRDASDSFDGSLFYVLLGAKNVRVERALIADNVLGHLVRGELQFVQCRLKDNYFRRGAYSEIAYHEGYIVAEEYNNCVRDQQPMDPDFTIIRRPSEQTPPFETVSVALPSENPFEIGTVQSAKQEGKLSSFGVDVDSIRVHRLPGNPELLHIEWIERPQGWYTEECYYSIRKSDEPNEELLQGKLHLDTDGYTPIVIWGDYRISYDSNILGVSIEREEVDLSPELKPLYYPARHYRRLYKASIMTHLRREYRLTNGTLVPMSTVLKYRIQDGDTLRSVCEGLGVNLSWIEAPERQLNPGEWITITIPSDLPKHLYPTIVEKSLGLFKFLRITWGKE